MSLISLQFIIFFIAVLIIYYLLPGKLQWAWLLLASALFYYSNATVTQCIVFLIYLVINWYVTLLMGKSFESEAEDASSKEGLLYKCLLIFDILVLAVFKYAVFFYEIIAKIASLFNVTLQDAASNQVIITIDTLSPPRISYFALIVIGYITSVHWGKSQAQKNPGKFMLFAGYFPQMTSGPIVDYEDMEGRLFGERHSFSYERVARGLMRAMWGMFKKLVIAERLAIIVNTVYSYYDTYPGFYIIFAAACFAFQLYTDFSGLMDIVLGASECLGIELPENFDTPFYSLTLAEFWRRWHITLGGFLKNYVFYAVQRSKGFTKLRKFCKKKLGKGYEKKYNIPQFLGLLISWFLIGLWHGGGWNYIWGVGLYMGIIIILSELLQPVFKWIVKVLHINTDCFSYRLFCRIRTFFIFIFGLSFFRASTLTDGIRMWKSGFSLFNPWIFFDQSIYNLGLEKSEFQIALFALMLVFVVSYIKQTEDVRDFLMKQNFVFRVLIVAVLFVLIITWGYYGSNYNAADFIYGRF